MSHALKQCRRGLVAIGTLCAALLLGACAATPDAGGPVIVTVPVVIVPVEAPHRHPLPEQPPYRPPVDTGPLVCGLGQQGCQGPYGNLCFTPSKGERCTQGVVCGMGQQACLGRYGAQCYTPTKAETCQQGVVCGMGQQVCARGREARCYTPSKGETCR